MDINIVKLKEAEDFYRDRIQGWMITDLKRSLEAKTNFLTALGCVSYTEIIGRFLPPIDNEVGKREERAFYRAFRRLPSNYYLNKLEKYVQQNIRKNFYNGIRHGLVHCYFPNLTKKMPDGTNVFWASVVARDGFVISNQYKKRSAPIFIDNGGRIILATKNYVTEIEKAVKIFIKETFQKKNILYQQYAVKGVDYIFRGIKS